MRKTVTGLLAGAALIASVVACKGASTSSHHVTASQSAVAKSDARALAAKCVPQSAVAQINLARSLRTVAGRHAFEQTCGIPAGNKARFEAAVLSAAETGHLTTTQGRTVFFSVTLPKLIEENQG